MQAGLPAAEVRAQLLRVLERNELHERESLLERFIKWLAPHLDTVEVKAIGDLLLAFLLVSAALAGALVLRRAWVAFRAPRNEPEAQIGQTLSDSRARLHAIVARAQQARAEGDLRLALRLLFQALLMALGGRGDLELNAAWTNRELLRRGKASREARALLEPLVRELEPLEFGRAQVGPEDVDRLQALLQPHLVAKRGPT